jgi:hypothetical protein
MLAYNLTYCPCPGQYVGPWNIVGAIVQSLDNKLYNVVLSQGYRMKLYAARNVERNKENANKSKKKAFIEAQLAGPSNITTTMLTSGLTSLSQVMKVRKMKRSGRLSSVDCVG